MRHFLKSALIVWLSASLAGVPAAAAVVENETGAKVSPITPGGWMQYFSQNEGLWRSLGISANLQTGLSRLLAGSSSVPGLDPSQLNGDGRQAIAQHLQTLVARPSVLRAEDRRILASLRAALPQQGNLFDKLSGTEQRAATAISDTAAAWHKPSQASSPVALAKGLPETPKAAAALRHPGPLRLPEGYRQNASLWAETRDLLLKDKDLRHLFKDQSVQIPPGAKVFRGGLSVIAIDPAHPDEFYKIALFKEGFTKVSIENEANIKEASALLTLHTLGVRGIPRITEIGVNLNGAVWIKLRGIKEGTTLRSPLWQSLPMAKKLDILIHFAGLFEKINQKGWTHNDIKPDNLLINDRGQAMILDLGAALPEGSLRTFRTNDFAATEKIVRKNSDVYSFGKTLEYLFLKNVDRKSHAWDEMKSCGLAHLIEQSIQVDRTLRRPNDMRGLIGGLKQARDYFARYPLNNSSNPVDTEYSGYTLARLNTLYDISRSYTREYSHADRIAWQLWNHFNYLDRSAISSILRTALEQASKNGEQNGVSAVLANADVLGGDILLRIWNDRASDDPPQTAALPPLGGIYALGVQTQKQPSAQWLNTELDGVKKTLFELRIPIPAEGELSEWNKAARENEQEKIAEDIARWKATQQERIESSSIDAALQLLNAYNPHDSNDLFHKERLRAAVVQVTSGLLAAATRSDHALVYKTLKALKTAAPEASGAISTLNELLKFNIYSETVKRTLQAVESSRKS